MAAIQYLESTPVTTEQSHTGDTSWTDVHANAEIATGAFTGSKKYLVIVNALFRGSDLNTVVGIRTVHGATPTAFASSTMQIEPNTDATFDYDYFWWTVFDQPATPETIKVQFKTLDSGQSVFADEIRVFAINLDDDLTENTDWHFNENTSGATHTNTAFGAGQTDRASVTFTPGSAGDDWLILSRTRIEVKGTTLNYEIATLDEGDALVRRRITHEGEDITDEFRVHTIPWVAEGLSAAEHTYKIQSRDDAAAGNEYNSSAVLALNLDLFESHSVIQTTGTVATTTSFTEIATLGSYSPTTTGDHLVIGDALLIAGFAEVRLRLQFDGTSDPTGWETDAVQWRAWDDTDEFNLPVAVIRSISSGGVTVDLDGDAINTADLWGDRTLIAFSMELLATVVPGKIIIQNI